METFGVCWIFFSDSQTKQDLFLNRIFMLMEMIVTMSHRLREDERFYSHDLQDTGNNLTVPSRAPTAPA